MPLRLPLVLTSVVVGVVAVAACGGGEEPEHTYHCFGPIGPDAGAGEPDAGMCGQDVTDPADCPEGCEPLG
jgi:hypothetical protein